MCFSRPADKKFAAHKTILMRSPYFAAMFKTQFQESKMGQVEIKDVDKEVAGSRRKPTLYALPSFPHFPACLLVGWLYVWLCRTFGSCWSTSTQIRCR